MLLCDVGNYSAKFWEDGVVYSKSIDETMKLNPKDEIFYISVNTNFSPKSSKFIDIKSFFKFDTIYRNLGIDRVAGCYTIENGVVVDAGSAITIDLMLKNTHQGGFIIAGISSQLRANKEISPVLDISFISGVSLECLPQKTADAVSYGIISPAILSIKHIAKDKKIYFTGGDGSFFSKFISNSIYDKNLVFKGMLKALKEKGIYDNNSTSKG